MNKIKDYIKENKKQSLFLTLVVFLAFATALVINSLTPYTVDDYSYMLNMVDRSRLTNFFDIFPSIYAHTMIVNGRAVPHFFVQFFLLPGMSKVWFNIVNSFVFVLLGLLIFFIANVKSTKTAGKLLLIYCLIFAFSPVIGQTCFWLDGACNYMWGVVTVLLSILPFQYSFFRETPKASSVPFVIFSSVVSFVAGTWSENTSAAAFCIMFGYIVLSWLLKKKVYLYMYTSFACCVLGWILMILSPGQLSRMEKKQS